MDDGQETAGYEGDGGEARSPTTKLTKNDFVETTTDVGAFPFTIVLIKNILQVSNSQNHEIA